MSIVSNTKDTLYDGYSVASTGYVYTSEGSTALTDGWFSARYDENIIQNGFKGVSNKTLTIFSSNPLDTDQAFRLAKSDLPRLTYRE